MPAADPQVAAQVRVDEENLRSGVFWLRLVLHPWTDGPPKVKKPECPPTEQVSLTELLRRPTDPSKVKPQAWHDQQLEKQIKAYRAAGMPDDGLVPYTLQVIRDRMARLLAHGGKVPSWLPPSVAKLMNDQAAAIAAAAPASERD
jgi:hypothetical protein